ncbi:dammaradiene synthase [Ceratobasidium sp. AG-Ba]|nr:dammaradiene synthase [Ceratobasidium sp. AG-Ba]
MHLTSTHDCEAPITHPSEHNAMLVVGHKLTEERREARAKLHDKWDKQTRATLEKGKVPEDGWEAASIRRAQGHGQAFMRPVPNPSLEPVIPFGAETCAAHDGGVLDGRRLNERPTDGKYSAGVCAAGVGLHGILPVGGFSISAMGACSLGGVMGGCG